MEPQINVSLHVTCLKQFKMSPWALLRRLCALFARLQIIFREVSARVLPPVSSLTRQLLIQYQ